jgi:hypothetical protein
MAKHLARSFNASAAFPDLRQIATRVVAGAFEVCDGIEMVLARLAATQPPPPGPPRDELLARAAAATARVD